LKLGTLVVLNTVVKPVDFGFKRSKVGVRVRVTTLYSGAVMHLYRVYI